MKLSREKIDLICARRCMSAGTLAKAAGMSHSALATLLSKPKKNKPDSVGRIAKALGVDVLDIIEDEI